MLTKSDKIKTLVACGESIIENAASIIGDEKYVSEITVTIRLRPDEAPSVNIYKDIVPEGIIEGVDAYYERKLRTLEILERNRRLNEERKARMGGNG